MADESAWLNRATFKFSFKASLDIKDFFNILWRIQNFFNTMRSTGTYATSTTLGEAVKAFVPRPLPPARPVFAPDCYVEPNGAAELAFARLGGVSGLCPAFDWLLYCAIR